jgi:hypothetical protein
MKNKKIPHVGTVKKIIETQAKSIPLPHIHDRALS